MQKLYKKNADATEKTVTGLGVSSIINPEYENGGWNKVYFGSKNGPIGFSV